MIAEGKQLRKAMISCAWWFTREDRLFLACVLVGGALIISARVIGNLSEELRWIWGPLFGETSVDAILLAGVLCALSFVVFRTISRNDSVALLRKLRSQLLVGYLLLGTISFGFFYYFRSHVDVGDGPDLTLHVPIGIFIIKEPVGTFFQHVIYVSLQDFVSSPRDALAILSCLSGAASVIILAAIARELIGNTPKRILFMGLILSNFGLAQLFFGHIETYPVFVPFLAAYVLVALLYLRGKCGIELPSLAYGIAFTVHSSAAWLAPSLPLLLLLAYRKQPFAARSWVREIAIMAIVGALPYFFVYGAIGELDYPLSRKWGGVEGFVPVENWLSESHLLSFIREQLLLAPTALLSLGLFIPRIRSINLNDSKFLYLASLALPYAIYSFVWNATLPGFADWDLFSPLALLLPLFSSYLLVSYLNYSIYMQLSLAFVLFVNLFFAVPMIAWAHEHSEGICFIPRKNFARVLDSEFEQVDELDVGNLQDERLHGFTVTGIDSGVTVPYPLGIKSAPGAIMLVGEIAQKGLITASSSTYPNGVFVIDDGRYFQGSEEFTVTAKPGGDLLIIKRIHSGLGNQRTRVSVNGKQIGEWTINPLLHLQNQGIRYRVPSRGSNSVMINGVFDRSIYEEWAYWLDAAFMIPGDSITTNKARVKFDNLADQASDFYYFFLTPALQQEAAMDRFPLTNGRNSGRSSLFAKCAESNN